MPISYGVDNASQTLRVRVSGDLTRPQLLHCLSACELEGAVCPGMPRLVDIRGVSPVPATQDIVDFARHIRSLRAHPAGRIAAAVASDLEFGMVVVFGAHAGIRELLQPFREESDALEWLYSSDPRPKRVAYPHITGAGLRPLIIAASQSRRSSRRPMAWSVKPRRSASSSKAGPRVSNRSATAQALASLSLTDRQIWAPGLGRSEMADLR